MIYLKEEIKSYSISFKYNAQNVNFESSKAINLYIDIVNWLYKNGYTFSGEVHNNFIRKTLTLDEVNEIIKSHTSYKSRGINGVFFKIEGSNKYMYKGGNIDKIYPNIIKYLVNFGIDEENVMTKGFEKFDSKIYSVIKKFGEIDTDEEDILDLEDDDFGPILEPVKYTFIEAAQICLKNNNNKPMSAEEIWNQISDKVQYITKTPVASLNTILGRYAENSNYKSKRKTNPILKIVSSRPIKYVLLNPDSEIQKGIEDDIIDYDDDEDYDIKPFPYQPEKTKAQIQAQREKIKSNKLAQAQGKRVKNSFIQSICVLGESGAGKSYIISKILESEGHEFQFIIPTAATTGLLSQYSPRKKEYVPSRLSQMIIEAYANSQISYTAVFDECHKSNVIEMINDELLQAISIRRNDGKRFISLDDDTSEQVFGGVYKKIERGNILIPDNLGFIFISSNPRVIGSNPDFLNRVDLVEMTEDKRDKFRTSEGLIEKSLKQRDEKLKLIEKLRSM